jgi:hypothetical protein
VAARADAASPGAATTPPPCLPQSFIAACKNTRLEDLLVPIVLLGLPVIGSIPKIVTQQRVKQIKPKLDAGFQGLGGQLENLASTIHSQHHETARKLDSHHSEISLKLESLSQQAVQVRARPCVQAPQPLAGWLAGWLAGRRAGWRAGCRTGDAPGMRAH